MKRPESSNRTKAILVVIAGAALALVVSFLLRDRDFGYTFGAAALASGICGLVLARRRFFRSGSVFMACGLVMLALGLVELAIPPGKAYLCPDPGQKYPIDFIHQQIHNPDDTLGWTLIPDQTVRHTGYLSPQEVEWEVTYHTDDKGRRIVPDRPAGGKAVLLFGASYTFGFALDDEDTIAARLQKLLPDRRVFNYGVNGYNTAQCCLMLQRSDPDPADWVVYIMIGGHLKRNTCMGNLRKKYASSPLFEFDFDSQGLVYKKPLDPFKRFKLSLQTRSFFGDRIVLAYDGAVIKIRDYRARENFHSPDYESLLTKQIILEMKEQTRKKWGEDCGFLVVNFPFKSRDTNPAETEKFDEFIELLESENLEVLDLDKKFWAYLEDHKDERFEDMFDRTSHHPTPDLAQLFAQWIAQYLDQKKTGP